MRTCPAHLSGLSGIPEWKWNGVWSQAAVNARWAQIGAPLPAPLVPVSLEGAKLAPSRGPRMIYPRGSKKQRHVTAEENDFWNYFYTAAVDPYRKQSGISKAAGVVLQVAGAAIPAFGYFQAVQAAGNMALQANAPTEFAKLETKVMAPALAAQNAAESAQFTAQIEKLKSLAPAVQKASGPSPAALAQQAFAAAPAPAQKTAIQKSTYLPLALAFFAAGAVLIIGVRR